MVLPKFAVEQILRDAVSLFSLPSAENGSDSAGVAAAATVRGFWFSEFHAGGKAAAKLNKKRLWDEGCHLPWLAGVWGGTFGMKSSEHQGAH